MKPHIAQPAERAPHPAHAAERTPLPADRDGPVFAEPWQASAFALAVHLSEQGAFAWSDWSAALGREIEAAGQRGPEEGAAYYHRWLDALERLCREKGLVDAAEIDRRREEWRQAYLNTPHGEPVELTAATADSGR
jgi:nitrile hydratase accessory protein